ncbi:tetratricopeptide repeat protein [Algibacter mikhailovii]|uniref:tetratricopeptide repeat protein n=1 Tax=Algibacter mikhailovii TaxID=425498 RepID=UPI0024947F6F|nr:tetratricopeptide repeat protein [Algibacter mikhailovii]
MKKQIIIALAIAIGSFSFAQKKELKAAEKAIKGKAFGDAITALNAVKPMLESLDPKLKDKYYYLHSVALFADGKGSDEDIDMALEDLNNIESSYGSEKSALKTQMTNDFLQKGNKNYEAKDFGGASKYFEKTYDLNTKDTIYLYYAAATAVSVPDYDRALVLYNKLKDLGYTGIQEEYIATGKEDGEIEVFQNENLRDLSVKSGTHIKPATRKTESKRGEIVKNVALIYINNGDNEKAIEAMKEARASNPDDVNLILSEANVQFKMGNMDEFSRLLKEAIEVDPNNAELRYNLGVIAAEAKKPEEARAHYEKAIELDPEYINAYINLSALILGGEQALIEEMNGLGNSSADNKRYDELKEQRQQLYRDAIPYLTKALEYAPKNINAAKTLMNIYSILGETDKYKEMKARVDEIEAAQ